jgi:biotin transport system substrate-specific component
MLRSNLNKTSNKKHLLLAGAFLLLVILGAKLDLDLGGLVSFTLQTLFLGLAYYYLPKSWRLILIFCYLMLGILGIPVFNGGVGWFYFSSWPLGFFVGFAVCAFLPVASPRGFASTVRFFAQVHGIIILLGVVWVGLYAGSSIKAFETFIEILPGAFIKTYAGAGVVWLVTKVVKPKHT